MGLTLDHIRARKGDFQIAADFTVAPGARVAVIGPSGAGKSTLFDVLAGFLAPRSGEVYWAGRPLSALAPGQRPMAMLFQDNNLFPHLTVRANVALALTPRRRLSAQQVDQVERVLSRVGLGGMGGRRLAALSGGQISRAALARLLLQDRPLWLLDEPFAALGPGLKSEMIDLVADMAREKGVTVMMITHDPKDALQFADQTVLVEDGVAHPPVDTQTLLANPPDGLQDYLGR